MYLKIQSSWRMCDEPASWTRALTVFLTSSDTTEVTVPTPVTIPAGKSSAIFFVDAVYDGIMDPTQIVTITASAAAFPEAKNTLDVDDIATGFTVTQTDGTTSVSESETSPTRSMSC